MQSKHCKTCSTSKPLAEFYKDNGGKYGVRSDCRLCAKQAVTDSYKKPGGGNARLKRKFGITEDQWNLLFEQQGRCCAICSRTEPNGQGWCVDHDHRSGKVRGILCFSCNTGLGKFGDDISTLETAVNYLRKN